MAIRKIISEIKVNNSSIKAIERLVGAKTAARIKKSFVEPKIKKLGNMAQSALKSTVPVDTKELRNVFIVQDYYNTDHVRIGIAPGTHYGRDQLPRGAAALADLLNKNGIFKRSKRSISDGPFSIYIPAGSPTAQWIDRALTEFKKERRKGITNGR